MRRALLIAALVVLAAAAAHADIRILMKARGYSSPYQSKGKIEQGGSVSLADAVVEQPVVGSGCTFPAAFPCTMN